MFFDRIKRPVTVTVLVSFLSMVLQPLSAMAHSLPVRDHERHAQPETDEARYSRLLNEVHEVLKQVTPQSAMPNRRGSSSGGKDLRMIGPNVLIEVERERAATAVDVARKVSELRAKVTELASLESQVRRAFEATERHIRDNQLPAEILARHEQAVRAYEARNAEFKTLIAAVERAAASGGEALDAALADLGAFMAKYPNQKPATPTDPNKLPWGSPKPVTREPYTSPMQFRTSRLFGEPVRLAQAGSLSGISLPGASLPPTPVAADTAATEDAQITPAIRDLAASLNNSPVQIYNWVRNNIDFIPTYGSLQGSDLTLQSRAGNAFDVASLLIALLRAANIPARYVYGTVEVPADKAMNWVGGMNLPRAAMDLMAQGGIPNVGVTQSGAIRWIRMEHVWVEAFVDYVPSRGAVNRQPNTWVPLDASFKQHRFAPGLDVKSAVPFDSQSALNQFKQGATINEQEGWAQKLNSALLQQSMAAYRTQALAYINAQKPNATADDLLGAQFIIPEERPILLGTLPYKTIVVGARLQSLPPNLQHRLTLRVFDSALDQALDNPSLDRSLSLAALGAKRLAITYVPSTAADAKLIQSYRDQGSKSLPLYLIRMTPALRLDQDTLATGAAIGMGQPQYVALDIVDPQGQNSSPTQYTVSAGDEIVLGIDAAGVSPETIRLRASRVDTNSASENLFQVALHYWMEHDLFGAFAGRLHQTKPLRLPSHGLFSAPLSIRFLFGFPSSGSYKSRTMDVKRSLLGAAGLSGQSTLPFVRQAGLQGSYLEGAIFEQLFGRPPGSGISAVHALHYANRAGVPIYEITQANYAAVINALQVSAAVKADIANAVTVGRTVTVAKQDIEQRGWSGTGYIIVDNETGAGAYLIDGGLSGGADPDCDDDSNPPSQPIQVPVWFFFLLALLLFIAWLVLTGGWGGVLAPAAAGVILVLLYPLNAEASFNRNKCCEDAKRDAAAAADNLNRRLDEWAANLLGLRDAGHWDAIAQEKSRLDSAIGKIAKYCRGGAADVAPEWTAAAERGATFLSTTPRPPK